MKWNLSFLFLLLFPLSVSADITSFVASGLSGSSPTIKVGTTDYLTFKSASNTNLQIEFGDGGTTASQLLLISPGTLVSDNDAGIQLCGGGKNGGSTCSAGWGAMLEIYGEDHANKGDILLNTGDASGSDVAIALNASNSIFGVRNSSNQTMWSFDNATASLTQNTTNGGSLIVPRLGASSTGQYVSFGAGSTSLAADVINTQTPSLVLIQKPAAGSLDWSGMVGIGATANGPKWDFLKTRSTSATGDADTIVTSGDQIGVQRYYGADGANYVLAGQTIFTVDGTPGTNDMPGAIDFQLSPDGSATPASALKITNDKKVTLGGQVVMAGAQTASSGIVQGLSAIPADVTSAIAGAELYNFNSALATTKNAAFAHGQANANGPQIEFMKSRATDGSADTIVNSADTLLDIKAFGSNGATFDNAAELTVEVDGTPGASNDMPGRFVFYVSPDGSASVTEAMRISSTQKVTFAGNDLGWTIVDQTDNQACTTGCTSACVAGQDLAGANKPLVTCADTTADICLCAGAS